MGKDTETDKGDKHGTHKLISNRESSTELSPPLAMDKFERLAQLLEPVGSTIALFACWTGGSAYWTSIETSIECNTHCNV